MKRGGILNHQLAAAIAQMGHYDVLLVCGAAYPVAYDEHVIDLAVAPRLPETLDVLRAIRTELWVEKVVFIEDALRFNQRFVKSASEIFPDAETETRTNDWFHGDGGKAAKFIVRTGGWAPWANVGLVAGIPFVEWVANADGVVPDDWQSRYELNREHGHSGLGKQVGSPRSRRKD